MGPAGLNIENENKKINKQNRFFTILDPANLEKTDGNGTILELFPPNLKISEGKEEK